MERAQVQDERRALAKIRLVAVDLDGTLLSSRGNVSRRTRTAVRKAPRYGVSVSIASGRSSYTTSKVARWVGASGPQIAVNGAHVLSPGAKDDWQFTPIPPDVLPDLISALRRVGVAFHAALRGRVAVEKQFMSARYGSRPALASRISGFFGLRLDSPLTVLPRGGTERLAGEVAKVYINEPREKVNMVIQSIDRYFGGRLRYVRTRTHKGDSLLEIQDASVSKGQALLLAAERMGVSAEEIAAVGDGDNDVEMIEAAEVGVAVANATPRLAIAANRFTLSCDDDGVARFLEEIYRAKR